MLDSKAIICLGGNMYYSEVPLSEEIEYIDVQADNTMRHICERKTHDQGGTQFSLGGVYFCPLTGRYNCDYCKAELDFKVVFETESFTKLVVH